MTEKEAYYLELRIWTYIYHNNGSDDGLKDAFPELNDYDHDEPYCNVFNHEIDDLDIPCQGCPLAVIEGNGYDWNCTEQEHPWLKWSRDKTKENAKEMLNLIINTKDK